MTYLATLLTIFAIGAITAVSMNLAMGYAGQMIMTMGAVVGVGAYATALVSVSFSIPWLALPVAGIVGAGAGALLAILTARDTGYVFVLLSLMLQMFMVLAFERLPFTGGTSGFVGIPRPSLGQISFSAPWAFAALSLSILVLYFLFARGIARSPYGLALRGFRNSERGTAALGWETPKLRTSLGALVGLGAGLAGSLHASFVSYIHPSQFDVQLSILILVYVLVGGLGNLYGSLVGVLVVMAIPEVIAYFRFVPVSTQGVIEEIMYGLVILGFIWYRRQGLLPERASIRVGSEGQYARN